MDKGRLTAFLLPLKQANLTRQQHKTLRGQALTGDIEGAEKGLRKLTQWRTGQWRNIVDTAHTRT